MSPRLKSRGSLALSLVLASGWLACATFAPAETPWLLKSESARQELGHGAWQVTKKIAGQAELEVSLVFFNANAARVRIVSQQTPDRFKAQTLEQLAGGTGAIAACNGGYFTPEFGPSGLEIAQGVRTGAWQKGLPFGGVFFVLKQTPSLQPDGRFQMDDAITDLVQCCPMLVQDGAALRGIGGEDEVARTFVACGPSDQWLIGYCPRATLPQLAGALVSAAVLHEFRVQQALNLDGGPSSGLWWKPATGPAQSIRGRTRVRNVITILPK